MTKQFLISVDYEAGQPSHPDDFIRAEIENYAGALFEFYGHGQPPKVQVLRVNPAPHVLTDLREGDHV